MNLGTLSGSNPPTTSLGRRPGRLRTALIATTLALVTVVAGFGVYVYSTAPRGGTILTVYTYSSLLGGGCGGNISRALAPFATAHHLSFRIECPSGTLASTLIAEANAPAADLVIGLDEITTPQADRAGVLVPYASPEIARVPSTLVQELSPDHATTPYEWGYLGLDECAGFANSSSSGPPAFNFPALAANTSWARQLLIEDPASDIVGQEFLLWQMEFYAQVLHQPWTPFWTAVAPYMTTTDSWDHGSQEFTCGAGTPQLFASFLNDPAYAAYSGSAGIYNSSPSWWNGTAYGWKTIYGVGIVRGSAHLALDRQFVDWFLQGELQSQLSTTEWEFPANDTIGVPSVYGWAMNSSLVHPLNDALNGTTIANDLGTWTDEWQAAVNAAH